MSRTLKSRDGLNGTGIVIKGALPARIREVNKKGLLFIITLLLGMAAASVASAAIIEVSIEGNQSFDPATVNIEIGDTVRWTNNDSVINIVSSDGHPAHTDYPDPVCPNPGCFDSGDIAPAATYSFTFNEYGTWGYHNHIKPGKRGTIVNPAPVPPGEIKKILDTTPPADPAIVINNDETKTALRAVTLMPSVTDGQWVEFSEDPTLKGAPQVHFSNNETFLFTLSDGDGTKTVYARFMDGAGNLSNIASDTIILERPPVLEEITTVGAEAGGEVVADADGDSTVVVSIPPGAVAVETDFAINLFAQRNIFPSAPLAEGFTPIGDVIYDITSSVAGEPVTEFTVPLHISFTYSDAQLLRIDEAMLRLAMYDVADISWRVLEDAVVDLALNRVTYETTHLTRFALVAVADLIPPLPPTNPFGVAGENAVTLAWTIPEADFNHVRIYRSETPEERGTLLAANITEQPFTDDGAQPQQEYTYTFYSVDRSGNISSTGATFTVPAYLSSPSESEVTTSTIEATEIADGNLVRMVGEASVWIVKKVAGFTLLRHVLHPSVPAFYVHLGENFWDIIRAVEGYGLATISSWVRCSTCSSGYQVWEINGDGTRHHLNMTWEQFTTRLGGDAAYAYAAIFEINREELEYYALGSAVLP